MTRDEIVQASKDEEGGMYIVIPSVVKLDEELPLSAQMLYGIITWKCNKRAYTWATNRELGEALGVSAKRASALLSLLERRGHIETEIEYKDGTNEILHRYIYPVMKSAKGLLRTDPPPKNKDTPPSECGYLPSKTGGPPPENAEVICNIKNNIKNNTPHSPPAGGAAPADKPEPAEKPKTRRGRQDKSAPAHDPEAFEIMWAAYPRKDNWKKSIEAWDKLKPDRGLCRVMYVALKQQCRDPKWAEDGGRYIPMFSTWLNQCRWKNQGVDLSLIQPSQPPDDDGWADY